LSDIFSSQDIILLKAGKIEIYKIYEKIKNNINAAKQ